MASNNSIQILRGTTEGIANNGDIVLMDGQPLYDKTKNWLTVGDGTSTIAGGKSSISIDFSQDSLTSSDVESIWGDSSGDGSTSSGGGISSALVSSLSSGKVPKYNGTIFEDTTILTGDNYIGFIDNGPTTGGRHIHIYKDRISMLSWDLTTESDLYNFKEFNDRLNAHDSKLSNHETRVTNNETRLSNMTSGLNTLMEGKLPMWNGSAFKDSRVYLGTNYLGFMLGNSGYAFSADGIHKLNSDGSINSTRHSFSGMKTDIADLETDVTFLKDTVFDQLMFNNGSTDTESTMYEYEITKPGIYIASSKSSTYDINIYIGSSKADADVDDSKSIILIVPQHDGRCECLFQSGSSLLTGISTEPFKWCWSNTYTIKSASGFRLWSLTK